MLEGGLGPPNGAVPLALEFRRCQRRSRQAPIGPTLTATKGKGQPLERLSLRPKSLSQVDPKAASYPHEALKILIGKQVA